MRWIKANYCGCWNLKPKEKTLENLNRSGSIREERKELTFPVQLLQRVTWTGNVSSFLSLQMLPDLLRFSSVFCLD